MITDTKGIMNRKAGKTTISSNTVIKVNLNAYRKDLKITLHPLYLELPCADVSKNEQLKYIDNCSTRRPVVILRAGGNKRTIIDNRYCYAHACRVSKPDDDQVLTSQVSITIYEVTKMHPADIKLRIFLDSLGACPLLPTKPLFKASIVDAAYFTPEFHESLKIFFDMHSLSAFGQTFGIPPSMFTRLNLLGLSKSGKTNDKVHAQVRPDEQHAPEVEAETETVLDDRSLSKWESF